MYSKKIMFTLASLALFSFFVLLSIPQQALAHGYVSTPVSRGYQGKLDSQILGWTQAHQMYGNVISNPQSLEYLKGFPEAGPSDGRIASAEGGLGQIADFVLDQQGADRWKKQTLTTGNLDIQWTYTALHRTTKWHYYITKPGWDPNQPLTRDAFEKISEIRHDGSLPTAGEIHSVQIPEDRIGYHVILAIWDIDDTPNAFYNVIDANILPGASLSF